MSRVRALGAGGARSSLVQGARSSRQPSSVFKGVPVPAGLGQDAGTKVSGIKRVSLLSARQAAQLTAERHLRRER